jgi:hypothetical protein
MYARSTCSAHSKSRSITTAVYNKIWFLFKQKTHTDEEIAEDDCIEKKQSKKDFITVVVES